MVDVTLDDVIRRYLAMNQLPLHYYVNALLVANQGINEFHFDALGNVKFVNLAIANDKVTLPNDFIEEVYLGIEVGDKVRKLGFDRTLNARENNNAFDQAVDLVADDKNLNNVGYFLENYYNNYGNFSGRLFGRKNVEVESYTINREGGFIRINNKLDDAITTLLLVYISTPTKVNDQTIVHPYAQRALIEFIGWQMAVSLRQKDMISYKRNEFYNEYRKLRARKNKMGVTEIVRSIRKNNNLAIKN